MDCALTRSTGPGGPFFSPKPPHVWRTQDGTPPRKISRAAFDRQADVIPQITRSPHPLASCLVQGANLVIGMGKNDPAALRRCLRRATRAGAESTAAPPAAAAPRPFPPRRVVSEGRGRPPPPRWLATAADRRRARLSRRLL